MPSSHSLFHAGGNSLFQHLAPTTCLAREKFRREKEKRRAQIHLFVDYPSVDYFTSDALSGRPLRSSDRWHDRPFAQRPPWAKHAGGSNLVLKAPGPCPFGALLAHAAMPLRIMSDWPVPLRSVENMCPFSWRAHKPSWICGPTTSVDDMHLSWSKEKNR